MLSQNDWNFNNIGTKFELDEVIPKFETEVRADANGEIIKNRDGSERRFNTDKIIGWKYNVTIKDGQFKKKSTQVSVDNPEALVDNDYIQAMDQVPVTFDNLQATMISSTMYYKADAIHLFPRCKTKISIRQGELILPLLNLNRKGDHMIKTVTKDDLIELGFAPGTARKIIHTGKLLLVNRGFNIYDNKRIGTIPASVAEELLGIELQKEA